MALAAGKHVFAEKPLCCGAQEAGEPFGYSLVWPTSPNPNPNSTLTLTLKGELFALAESSGKLLHTAYNRRSDPAIQARSVAAWSYHP